MGEYVYSLHVIKMCHCKNVSDKLAKLIKKNENWLNASKFEKNAFKVVQMKSLAMHITNQKLSFDVFTVGTRPNIFMEHDL